MHRQAQTQKAAAQAAAFGLLVRILSSAQVVGGELPPDCIPSLADSGSQVSYRATALYQ